MEPKKKTTAFTFQVFHFATALDKWLIMLAVLFNGITGLGMPGFNLIVGDMMDDMAGAKPSFTKYVLIQVYIGVGMFVLGGIGVACLEWVAERQVRAMRYQYLKAIMRQEIGWYDTFDTGTLASSLNKNCVTIRDGIGIKLGQLFMFIFMFFGGYGVGFFKSWKMTLVLSASLPVMVASGAFMMLFMTRAGQQGMKAYAKAGSVAEEIFANIRTVVAFGGESKSSARFDASLDSALRVGIRAGLFNGVGTGAVFACFFLTYALGFWYAAKLIADDLGGGCIYGTSDCISPGSMIGVFFAVVMAAFALGQSGPSVTAFLEACAAAKELLALIDRVSVIDPYSEEGIKDVKLSGEITFESVEFAFPARPDKAVYKNLTLTIPAGKTVALVGQSGCGKSTAIQLIERFYDVTRGAVSLDGINIKDFNVSWLREQMSIVTQEPRLFARSIRENIAYGKEGATEEEIIAVAKAANAHDFIMQFPRGYDTYVGEGGNQLSGGQKQRIAIARAMLRDPKILIIDEATSALDNESERIVQKSLDDLIGSSSRTTIVIAHRLTTIRNADLILVFANPSGDGAYIAEQGTHDELIAVEDGIYQSLVLNQELGAVARKRSRFNSSVSAASLRSNSFAVGRVGSIGSSVGLSGAQTKTSNKKRSQGLYLRTMKLMKPYWLILFWAIVAAIAAGVIFPGLALVYAEYIAVLYADEASWIRKRSSLLSGMYIVMGAGSFLFFTLRIWLAENAGQRMVRDLRSKAFKAMIHQNIAFFDEPMHTTGPLNEILSKEVLLMKGWCGDNVAIIIQNISSMISGLIIAFTSSPKLAAVSLAAFFITIPASFLEMQALGGNADGVKEASESPGFIMNEAVINARTVTAYSLQETFNRYHQGVLKSSFVKGRKHAAVMGFCYGLSQFLQMAVMAFTLWYGGKLIVDGELSDIRTVMRTIFALMFAGMGIGQNMVQMSDGTKAKGAAERVWEILDTQPSIDVRSTEGTVPEDITGAIQIRHLHFRYPVRPEPPVFAGVSFDVQAGQTVALVGASGCGKSTIIQLLERFYDVHEGTILDHLHSSGKAQVVSSSPESGVKINGYDVRTLNVSYLRSLLGLVSQEPALFNTTIAENIRYGKEDASMEAVISAAKMANAHDFIIEFPDGYDTNVGTFGGQLSGGQKQRIAIARALLRDPKILLLDEATSALDSESEKVVQAALDALMSTSKRTTLVVAHRLSTIRNADKIVVFKNVEGRGSVVAEVGTHDQLMQKSDGVYRKLVMIAERSQK